MTYEEYLRTMWVLWGLIAVVGGVVAGYSLLAWRRHHARPMLLLGVGLLMLSVVPAVMWLGLYTLTEDVYATTMYCTGVMLAGFAVLLVSITARAG